MKTLDEAEAAYDEAKRAGVEARDALAAATSAHRSLEERFNGLNPSGGRPKDERVLLLLLDVGVAEAVALDARIASIEAEERCERASSDLVTARAVAHHDPAELALADWDLTLADVQVHLAEATRLAELAKAEKEAAAKRVVDSHEASARLGLPRMPGHPSRPEYIAEAIRLSRQSPRPSDGQLQSLRRESSDAWARVEAERRAAADRDAARAEAERDAKRHEEQVARERERQRQAREARSRRAAAKSANDDLAESGRRHARAR